MLSDDLVQPNLQGKQPASERGLAKANIAHDRTLRQFIPAYRNVAQLLDNAYKLRDRKTQLDHELDQLARYQALIVERTTLLSGTQ